MSAAVIGTLKENPIDCSGKLKVMAKQVRPWLTQPSGSMGLIHKAVQVIRRQPAHPIRAGDSKSRTKAEYMAAILNLRTKTKRVLDKPGASIYGSASSTNAGRAGRPMMSRNISTRLSAVVRSYSSIRSRRRQKILDRPPQGMMGVWYDSVRNRQREKTGAI